MYFKPKMKTSYRVILLLCILNLCADAVRLIRENGYRAGSHYYHLGDGSHAYHVNLETGTSIYFKCVMSHTLRCSGRAIFRFGHGFRHSKPHNHHPDPNYVGERHFRENLLQEIDGARFVSFHDILDEYRRDQRYTRTVRARMNLRRLRGAMWRKRAQSYPAIPHTLKQLTQVLLNPNYRQKVASTFDGTDCLYAGSCTSRDGSHNVLFISRRMLDFLPKLKVIQSDGTFRARPLRPQSSQCFVLVTPWRHNVVPVAWILMERKSLSAYRAVLSMIKQLCPRFNPEKVVTDWEYSQQRAWQEAFPNATVQGCLWHLCRAFLKKAKALHILRFRHHFPSIIEYIRKACAIPLLPVRYFRVGLGVIMDQARDEDIVIAYLLRNFFNYIEEKWIGNVARRRYMKLWQSVERTNNLCESHNKMLRMAVGAYRPNVWAFIDALAKLEHNAQLDSMALNLGINPRRPRPCRSVWTDERLIALSEDLEVERFHDRNTSVANFLDRAVDLFHGAFNAHLQNAVGRDA